MTVWRKFACAPPAKRPKASVSIVVVIENGSLIATLKAAGSAHRRAKRILVRRRNQRDSCGGTSPNSLANIEALVVNRDRYDTATAEAKHLSRKAVPRLLHPNTAVRIKQYATRNRQGLLGPADNHDLVCLASYRARRPNVCCDYLAQLFEPQGIAVIERLVRNLAAVACHQCVPYA